MKDQSPHRMSQQTGFLHFMYTIHKNSRITNNQMTAISNGHNMKTCSSYLSQTLYLFKYDVNAALESLFGVNVQVENLLNQSLKLLRR